MTQEQIIASVNNKVLNLNKLINPIISEAVNVIESELEKGQSLKTQQCLIKLIRALDKTYETKAYLELLTRIAINELRHKKNNLLLTLKEGTVQHKQALSEVQTKEDSDNVVVLEASVLIATNKVNVLLELINAIKKILGGTTNVIS